MKRLTYNIHILKTEKMESDFVKKLKKNNLKLKIQYLQFKTNK